MRKIQPNTENITVGDEYFRAYAYLDDEDDPNSIGHVDVDVWVVRSIRRSNRRGYYSHNAMTVYLIQKNKFTWVKENGKSTKYSWAKSISDLYRDSFILGADLPLFLFTTARQALVHRLQRETDPKLIKLLKGRITKLRGKK